MTQDTGGGEVRYLVGIYIPFKKLLVAFGKIFKGGISKKREGKKKKKKKREEEGFTALLQK